MDKLGVVSVGTKNNQAIKINGSYAKRNYYKFYDDSYTKMQIRSVAESSNNKLLISTFYENPISEFHIINKETMEDLATSLPVPEENSIYILPDGEYEVVIKGNFRIGWLNIYATDLETEGSTVFIDEIHLQPKLTTGFAMFADCIGITEIKENIDVSEMTSASYMFTNCSNLKYINTTNWNFSKLSNITSLFRNCSSLEHIEFKNCDFSNAFYIYSLFEGCSSLKSIDISEWKTSNRLNSMLSVFKNCTSLEYINFGNLDFSQTTDIAISSMFNNCISLKTINTIGLKNISNMNTVFRNCSSLEQLDFSNWSFINCNNCYSTFENCSSLTELDLSNIINDNSSTGSTHEKMFGGCTSLKKLDISNIEVNTQRFNVKDVFLNCNSLVEIGFKFTDNQKLQCPSTVTKIFNINYDCPTTNPLASLGKVTEIVGGNFYRYDSSKQLFKSYGNLSKFIGVKGHSTLTTLKNFFKSCIYLKEIDLTNFDVENLTDISNLFDGCSRLKLIKMPKLNTNNITDMSYIFSNCNVLPEKQIKNIVSDWDVSNVVSMRSMFFNCYELTSFYMPNWNTNSLEDMTAMFSGCHNISSINLLNFNLSKVRGLFNCFNSCTSLVILDLSNLTGENIIYDESYYPYNQLDFVINDCTSLKILDISNLEITDSNVNVSKFFNNCPKLTKIGFKFTDKQKLTLPTTVTEIFNMNHDSTRSPLKNNTRIKKITGGKITNVQQSFIADDGTAWFAQPFGYMSKLEEIINVSIGGDSITNLNGIFEGNSKLKKIDMSKWNITNIVDISRAFMKCSSLQDADMSMLDMSNIKTMALTFKNCINLRTFKMGINTNKITNLESTFEGCNSLINVNLSKCNFSSLTRIDKMFYGCGSLKFLNITSINTDNITSFASFLSGVPKSCIILVSPNFRLTESQCGWNGTFKVIN